MPIKFYTPIPVLFVPFWFFCHSERKWSKKTLVSKRTVNQISNSFNLWSIFNQILSNPKRRKKEDLQQQAWNKNYHHERYTPFPLFIPTRAGSTREQDRTRQRNNPTVFSAFPISSGFLPSLSFLSFSFSQRVANKQTIPWTLKDEMENGDGGKRWEGKDERKR